MAEPQIAPYGAWKSPITSSLIVAQSISLMEVRLDGNDIYWLEGRPQERGRYVMVRAGADGAVRDVNAPPYNARTRVHEYGGGSWLVAGGTVYFSNFADGRLYRQDAGGEPAALTPAPPDPEHNWRYADGVIDRRRNRWIGVREDHTDASKAYPDNTIVAVPLGGAATDAGRVLAAGHDFFSSPRLSPDGRRLAYLTWDHPNMPWVGTTLYLVELGDDGAPAGAARVIAGGPSESLFQPEWSPDGAALVFVSDRTGWWNLYRYDLAARETRPLAPMRAEFGQPQWQFGMSTYAFAGRNRIVAAYVENGLGRLALIDLGSGKLSRLDLPFTDFSSVRADGGDRVVFRGGAFDRPASVVRLDLASNKHQVLRRSTDVADDEAVRRCLAPVEAIEFPTENGRTAFALYYPPTNPDYAAPAGEKPPLVVRCHGGPTSAAASTLTLGIHYWTSRGVAVIDVNYGGSTGYGREYRDRLHLTWGIVDVDDCINGAKYLAAQNRVDAGRSVITGGSAGGYTTLAALTFRDYFAGGASHFGVSDAAALAKDTHKFESRYLDWLIGPYPAEAARYKERSPADHAERLRRPVIFFQGDEDRIVPPNQTERMVDALRRNRVPVGYFLFAGEQHGFRQAGNIQRALDAELYFYAVQVFGTRLSF
ncbi:MAG TPA: prolyl oligopeptidase family serine peptidase [Xanthobacteraceae bacterium]|nr:prolyl oligopeptidase family serine peptidase [Xanthobacteraceae bacterium]